MNQSSTDFGGDADRANDGSADGNFDHGSVSHTAQQDYPEWWGEVKGGTSFGDVHMGKPLEKIYVYSRTDCCTNRLEGAEVWVHTNFKNRNGTFGQPWIKVATLNGRRAVYEILGLHNIGAIHQVKVRIPKKQAILSLAEVRLLTHD